MSRVAVRRALASYLLGPVVLMALAATISAFLTGGLLFVVVVGVLLLLWERRVHPLGHVMVVGAALVAALIVAAYGVALLVLALALGLSLPPVLEGALTRSREPTRGPALDVLAGVALMGAVIALNRRAAREVPWVAEGARWWLLGVGAFASLTIMLAIERVAAHRVWLARVTLGLGVALVVALGALAWWPARVWGWIAAPWMMPALLWGWSLPPVTLALARCLVEEELAGAQPSSSRM